MDRIGGGGDAVAVLLAIRAEMYVDSGAYSVYPYTAAMEPGMAMGVLPGPYAIRNHECRAYAVATDKSPLGPYRGVARPAACSSMERIVDAVAEATGSDPVEVRRRNMIVRDRFPYTTVTDLVYDSGDFVATIDAACDAVGYAALREEQERHLETPSPITVGGVKGMGEGGAIAPGPAVAGAVEDALRPLGAGFVGELPLTPQRVWSLIEGAPAS